jgi:putative phosphoribosyl transferase
MAYFRNRIEAGSRLAEELKEFAGDGGVVLAIPRGGVVVGYEIAQRLHLELDVIVPRKLAQQSELQLVQSRKTEPILDDNLISYLGVNEDYIRGEGERQKLEIKRRLKIYRQDAPPLNIKGRNVLVVDDGIATGSTMKAALASVKNTVRCRLNHKQLHDKW